ncbi:MAG: hypothetical protein V7K21_20040 [Nostoc sp.]|uniref:hypothetical protein n=1 Tax=Nostoc sp. TaxID=1180 RepID=UPI002FF60064
MPTLTPEAYRKIQQREGRLEPQEFCEKWIPKLYGVYPGEYLYRKACILEFLRLLPQVVEFQTIEKNWKWGTSRDSYPKYLASVLLLADQMYKVREALGVLPKYIVEPD